MTSSFLPLECSGAIDVIVYSIAFETARMDKRIGKLLYILVSHKSSRRGFPLLLLYSWNHLKNLRGENGAAFYVDGSIDP